MSAPAGPGPAAGATAPSPADGGRPPGRYDGTKHAAQVGAGAGALTVGALGVVFGDIGTSPLYAMKTVFTADDGAVTPTRGDVLGVVSLILWLSTLVVSVKYVTLVMRADNDGEGGIMALIALVQRLKLRGRAGAWLLAAGLIGAALFYGDGVITPAVSVLSAVEGIEVAAPHLEHLVVPLALAVIAGLFAIQRLGTGAVGRLFGPVMVAWFTILGVLGVVQVAGHPEVLRAVSPTYGVAFFVDHPGVAFIALGSIVLVLTGAEALYADMGHFGPGPIRRAWFLVVFPGLALNYLGQGSLILEDPSAVQNPFYLLVPNWGRVPMIVLATLATVIASQALISGLFSVTRQAVTLGLLPRLTIRHTSEHEIGQVYVPVVNWGLFVAVVAVVLGFGSSASLASAYGIAVTGTFVLTTVLFAVIARHRWRTPLRLLVPGIGALLVVDVAFFAANLTKVAHGGWFPLVVGAVVFAVLTTWRRGSIAVTANRIEEEGPLRAFVEDVHATEATLHRVPGTAVFLSADRDTTPLALRANVEHNRVLHEHVVIVSVVTTRVPHVPPAERIDVDDLGYADDGITHITARVGFQDQPDVPALLRLAHDRGPEAQVDVDRATFFVSRMTIVPTADRGLARWRKRLFVAMARNAASPVDYFRLPVDRTVTLGSSIGL
ncbi:potassium transporter Kup [Patulibacter sp. SYSU D01012]|uniref:potassium transporter Kup n=1 Tax=Patulibacter sp. SYSU D01012 TaxID=2817381 RepID=UPI001FED6089|nr:potassium transporter Kup [Patulibacter sp. SYSU D01012]